MTDWPGLFNYWVVVFLMMAGFYVVIAQGNLVKKLAGLALFQTSAFILYISMGNRQGGAAPILDAAATAYSNPLPQVLILTAIVVGVATTAVGLALVVRIKEAYGSVEEDEIHARDLEEDEGPDPDGAIPGMEPEEASEEPPTGNSEGHLAGNPMGHLAGPAEEEKEPPA